MWSLLPSCSAARICCAAVLFGGRHEGSDMGFPTANIQVPDGIQVPADGVYEGLVLVDDTVWPAAVNVGLPPTYADDAASAHLEANLNRLCGRPVRRFRVAGVYALAASVARVRFAGRVDRDRRG
ncbi:MAG: riboflavin kinase [Collinsella sp.]